MAAITTATTAAVTAAAGQKADDGDAVKLKATLVDVPVIVSDREGRYLGGLRRGDFTLRKDHVQQTIAVFETSEEPLNVALLLDTSWSTGEVLDDIKTAALSFVGRLRARDRAMVVSFDHNVHVLSKLTSDRAAVSRAVESAEIGYRPGTALRDAVMQTANESLRDVQGRKAIVLLTDGKDHGSRTEEPELLEMAQESGAMIYAIFYRTSPPQRGGRRQQRVGVFGGPRGGGLGERRRERIESRNEEAAETLQQLTEVSAGRFYRSEVTDLKRAFDLIAEELRHQYRLGFYAADEGEAGSVHRLTVEVKNPGAVVRARRVYRAGPPAQ